jgi:cobalt-zinc-cadmium efflux system outer membrane protein
VDAAWRKYEAASVTAAILNRGVLDVSERNLAVIRQAYNLGQLRLLDILNEQRRLLETELSYIDTEPNRLTAARNLNAPQEES